MKQLVKAQILNNKLPKNLSVEIIKQYIDLILSNTLNRVAKSYAVTNLQDLLNYKELSDSKVYKN